ncbi:2-keto-4-pentenoate hydratase [Weissella hellenica]|uniref:2-keto-4-pentenoate hydratase n=1 Tax=Weissella hellenica TaxID=46256 RepID=A0A4Y4G3X7_WEIHE|nr:2-keto-4-pentenoate hydratase [Weissella hellenica]NKY67206.1 2-keto-4-pentenoate hydratase [Weissella hellenica]GED36186.1 2-keto-4-pentenoate hydratase [Weissella hellenica]SCC00984.1 2-oxo-hept-3-ene-1,7-dioate hydratase [Weissella hellenica]
MNNQEFAQILYDADTKRQALSQSEYATQLDNESAAYDVQRTLMALKSEKIGGYKVSLTSKETQAMFDSDMPLYGAQVVSHFKQGPITLSANQVLDPLAEVELMFTAKEDLLPEDSLSKLMKKTLIAPAIEVPDSRFLNWFPSLSKYLVIADAAVGGYIVYGQQVETIDYFKTPDELASVATVLYHNGKEIKTGNATEVLGNPLLSLQWLVAKLASQNQQLTAGQHISSGTFLLPEHLTTGSWQASFSHHLSDVVVNVK